MQIKVCGMRDLENIKQVAALQPQYLGFIFYPKSPRFFTGTIPELPSAIARVGVFVNSEIKEVLAKVNQYKLNVVQLHGKESAKFVNELKIKLPANCTIWKVFSVAHNFDFRSLEAFEPLVDAFLFDAKGPAPGGNGYTFNWEVLKDYNSKVPLVISGGIGLEQLHELDQLKNTGLPVLAVDLNSKFETAPGLKNTTDLKTFMAHEL